MKRRVIHTYTLTRHYSLYEKDTIRLRLQRLHTPDTAQANGA